MTATPVTYVVTLPTSDPAAVRLSSRSNASSRSRRRGRNKGQRDKSDVVPVLQRVFDTILREREADGEIDGERSPDCPTDDRQPGSNVGVDVAVQHRPRICDEECARE